MKFNCNGECYSLGSKVVGPGEIEVTEEQHALLSAAQLRIFGKNAPQPSSEPESDEDEDDDTGTSTGDAGDSEDGDDENEEFDPDDLDEEERADYDSRLDELNKYSVKELTSVLLDEHGIIAAPKAKKAALVTQILAIEFTPEDDDDDEGDADED